MSTDASSTLRKALALRRDALRKQYLERPRPDWLLRAHSRLVDDTLVSLWNTRPRAPGAALIATGGYGRGELFPHSDIDLLVLLAGTPSDAERDWLAGFIGACWDAGLEIGHGVRTLGECVDSAASDITVQTALLEARLLAGSRPLLLSLRTRLRSTLDPARFLVAKKLEQEQRHAKHQDTPFSLEPNLKEAPGGLRDLQVIQWVALAGGLARRWRDLESQGLLQRDETLQLRRQEKFLRDLRIRLHYLAGRREDRVVFDFQAALAAQLGVRAGPARRPSEVFMQRYYRAAKAVTQLNRVLLQNLEARLAPGEPAQLRVINERFRARGDLLEAADVTLFEREPRAVLEGFLLMQLHRDLRGMSAATLRALWRARGGINAAFRRDPAARLLFVQILQQPRGIVHEFRRMNQYDVLGKYLPEFGRIVGQMQHDLFHVYTVDQHILMVVRNLRRFTMPEFAHEFPRCTQLISSFERHWLLYVAAIYHDIAKGRGGDHSLLGTRDVRRFCERHGISREDSRLVEFLVGNHLTMSAVAQKQDIHDPDVVRAFAGLVGSERRLIALYLLTVADVRGTSPKVWNAWKAKLLEDLFGAARRVLTGENLQLEAALAEKQAEALRLLRLYALPDESKDAFWAQLDTAYFLRHDAQEIAWQTRNLHYRLDTQSPVVRARLAPFGEGLQIMVYCPDRAALFARICGYFERANFSIVEAKIHTTRKGYALDTFLVLGSGTGVHYRDMMALIEKELAEEVQSEAPLAAPRGGRLSRRVRHFPISPLVDIRPDERGIYHALSLVASDRPGLLFGIARILTRHRLHLHSAKVNTLGDRAEDVFLLSGDALGQPKLLLQLEQELLADLQVKDALGEARLLVSPRIPGPARETGIL